jgi:peptidoglycan/xylan/chitin deacetylase (PgdA/CDA1 family)
MQPRAALGRTAFRFRTTLGREDLPERRQLWPRSVCHVGALVITRLLLIGVAFVGLSTAAAAGEPAASPVKKIYITFDDGPVDGTEQIIEIINRRQIHVSMMMVGSNVTHDPRRAALLARARADPYIFIGNHSYSHARGLYATFYSDPQLVLRDFDLNREFLQLGNKIARLPGRNIWQVGNRNKHDVSSGLAAARLLAEHGYSLFGWDIEWEHDPRTGRPIQTVREMVSDIAAASEHAFTENHIVVLAHDEMFRDTSEDTELTQLIDALKARGYVFESLASYPRD